MDPENTTETLSTVERAFDIIHTLRDMEGARVTELASEMDMATSTAHKYLATLASENYVVKEGDEYHIGLQFLDLSTYAKNRKDGYRFSTQKVREIAEETGERAQFVVEEGGIGIYVHTEAIGTRAVLINRRTGIQRHLHSTAAGKAILAELPEQRVEDIISEHGLPAETEHTITDHDTLIEELDEIRERGIAYNDEESVEGLRAVGVPVQGPSGVPLGALSVSGPSNRLRGEVFREELPNVMLGYANEVELNIRYP